MPVPLDFTSRRIVPLPVPVLMVTVHVAPEPLTFVTDAPSTPVVVKLKSAVSTPVMDSENVTVNCILGRLVGLAFMQVLEITVGAVVSITIFLLLPREPAAPGVGSVRIALFPAASLIVPPLRVSAVVAM